MSIQGYVCADGLDTTRGVLILGIRRYNMGHRDEAEQLISCVAVCVACIMQ